MNLAACVKVETEQGGCTASVMVGDGSIEIGVARVGSSRLKNTKWWIFAQSMAELIRHVRNTNTNCKWNGDRFGQIVVNQWMSTKVEFAEPDTPDEEDVSEYEVQETCQVTMAIGDEAYTLDIPPATHRRSSEFCARFLLAYQEKSFKELNIVQVALEESHAALNTERSKYRNLLAANPQKSGRYSSTSLLHPGRIRRQTDLGGFEGD
ncbi:hypothetical protein MPSI1_003586 [Malassezia psittaci]|uniref:Uncharacterized protein n=1 Tax=Malassezia psittaci TaxID=1821823 RepID=A0AAF0FCM8_9BASI|nr:hypothetical protein MPSI1_003586 [Malassezia psittaci]